VYELTLQTSTPTTSVYVERLELRDFRSYTATVVDLEPGASVFVGPNAEGKTNLLEALHYLAIGSSHRAGTDAPLVRAGRPAAVVRVQARVEGRQLSVEVELRPSGRNRARVNGQAQRRARDATGLVRSVLFAPEDLILVRGDPGERRRFLDDLLAQRRPAYVVARQEYDRVLRQRNALLKAARGGDRLSELDFETWTDALVRSGATLLAARIAAVHALAGPAADAYHELAAGSPSCRGAATVTLAYESSTGRTIAGEPGAGIPDPAELSEELRDRLAGLRQDERQRGLTLVGPHRDDLALRLGGFTAKGYASHGEMWSIAIALRLASRDVLHDLGEQPVVLLDDVFAELDENRRARLAQRCRGYEQVLVTAAVAHDVPLQGRRFAVRGGTVVPASTPGGGSGAGTGAAGEEGRS
jgi:DNA replication and repair protein RecF